MKYTISVLVFLIVITCQAEQINIVDGSGGLASSNWAYAHDGSTQQSDGDFVIYQPMEFSAPGTYTNQYGYVLAYPYGFQNAKTVGAAFTTISFGNGISLYDYFNGYARSLSSGSSAQLDLATVAFVEEVGKVNTTDQTATWDVEVVMGFSAYSGLDINEWIQCPINITIQFQGGYGGSITLTHSPGSTWKIDGFVKNTDGQTQYIHHWYTDIEDIVLYTTYTNGVTYNENIYLKAYTIDGDINGTVYKSENWKKKMDSYNTQGVHKNYGWVDVGAAFTQAFKE